MGQTLRQQQRDWEDLARVDPLWAILSDPEHQHGRWGPEEFFASGEEGIAQLLVRLSELGLPRAFTTALDFGCGAGRTARALAGRFDEVIGVDISAGMLRLAAGFNRGCPNLRFELNATNDLAQFSDRQFDLVYSFIVLQHQRSGDDALAYIREFVRVLRPGGVAVFQVPGKLRFRNRVQARRRLYGLLRRLGVSERRLYVAGLVPMRLIDVPSDVVTETVERAGGRLVAVDDDAAAGPAITSSTYFATR